MATAPRIDRLEKNLIINGNFDFWQRATSIAVTNPGVNTGYKSADRWFNWTGALNHNVTFSRQAGEKAQYCMRVQRNSGVSVTSNAQLAYTAEIADARMLAGNKITLQFRARKGANYSAVNSILESNISYGSGTTDSNLIMAGFTGIVTTLTNHTLTTSFQTFSVSVTLPTNVTQIGLSFRMDTVGTAGAADYFEIEQIMVTVGDLKEEFCRAGKTYAEELNLCQRYYEKSWQLDQFPSDGIGSPIWAVSASDGGGGLLYKFPWQTPKRAAPTVTIYSGTNNAINNVGYLYLTGSTGNGSTSAGGGGDMYKLAMSAPSFVANACVRVYFNYLADAEI